MTRFVKTCNIRDEDRLAVPVESSSGMVILAAGVELNSYYVERLESMGYHEVYVTSGSLPELDEYLIVPHETRQRLLRLSRKIYQNLQRSQQVTAARISEGELERAMEALLADLRRSRGRLIMMADIKSVDDYIFHHAVNVCIYSLLIGMDLKYTKDMLLDLGIGAFLLDVGKVFLSSYLLEKKGIYNASEFAQMKEHTSKGFDFLSGNRALKASQITLQHHERMDGSGYPRGLPGEQIHGYARIVGIADVYDSLMSNTTFRKRILPCKAIEYLQHEGQEQFDPQLMRHFAGHVALYPIGTTVELSNARTGVVAGYSGKNTGRPVVELIDEGYAGTMVDLDQEQRLFIRDVSW